MIHFLLTVHTKKAKLAQRRIASRGWKNQRSYESRHKHWRFRSLIHSKICYQRNIVSATLQCGRIEAPVHFDPASVAQPHHQPAAVVARRAPARCPYLYRQKPVACPASLILGTLFSQMTIESTSRDPSTAAELTRLHAASCKLRDNLPNLFPCPSFRGGYVRLMIHSRISARTLRFE
jgi:hypothetical protein